MVFKNYDELTKEEIVAITKQGSKSLLSAKI